MEEVIILKFITGTGDGYGYGDGTGNGTGNGYGYGYGYGYGDGDGTGNGDGNGYGTGNGNGTGNGYGDGTGDGPGNGIKLGTYKKSKVYYIDTLPCVFRSIKREVAMVDVIDTNSFLSTSMFVAKHGGLFAHGKTIKEAIEAACEKWAETRSIEERIEQFKSQFKKGIKYDAHLFYKWHTILTGSCQSGKDFWIGQQEIDLDKTMTVHEFFILTQNAYGGETIRKLMNVYK